jgi:hypothetical protein
MTTPTSMKNVEFFEIPLGGLFSRLWNGSELFYYYRNSISIEYVEHGCKQSFLNSLLYGKPPSVVPIRKYNNDLDWLDSKTLTYPEYPFKEYLLDIYYVATIKLATEEVLSTFNAIVESCPADNVVVFGYDLKFDGNQIIPGVIHMGREYEVFIECGFAGY